MTGTPDGSLRELADRVLGTGISVLDGRPYIATARIERRCCLDCHCEWEPRLVLRDLTRPTTPERDRPVVHWTYLNREAAHCPHCGAFGWTGTLAQWCRELGLPVGQLALPL